MLKTTLFCEPVQSGEGPGEKRAETLIGHMPVRLRLLHIG